MPIEEYEIKFDIDDWVHDIYKRHHETSAGVWNKLDTKAQGTIALSGIFLGGMLAFVRSDTPLTYVETFLLGIAVIMLGSTMLLALMVLITRAVFKPPTGGEMRQMRSDILKSGRTLDENILSGFHANVYQIWSVANKDVDHVNSTKALWLRSAHIVLFGAIFVACCLTLIRIGNSYNV